MVHHCLEGREMEGSSTWVLATRVRGGWLHLRSSSYRAKGPVYSLKPNLLETYFLQLDSTASQIGLLLGPSPPTYEFVGTLDTETVREKERRHTEKAATQARQVHDRMPILQQLLTCL